MAMATHSSILAWRVPWTNDSEELQSMGSQRIEHNWAINTFTFNLNLKSSSAIPFSENLYSHLSSLSLSFLICNMDQ